MPVIDLWKVDDKAWMKQRREEWKILEAGPLKKASRKEIAQDKKFFLTGADVGYIGDWFRYLMIPLM